MGAVIGDSATYSTWAALRTPIANDSIGGSPANQYSHSIDYLQGFYTTEGNGLIATTYTLALTFAMPAFNLDISGTFWSPNADINYIWTDAQKTELVGEAVANAGTPFNINVTAFGASPYQVTAGGVDPIYTIGKLTAF
jgi:hypothetical protein